MTVRSFAVRHVHHVPVDEHLIVSTGAPGATSGRALAAGGGPAVWAPVAVSLAVLIAPAAGCSLDPVPPGADPLSLLEARTGERWRGVFDRHQSTATTVARTESDPARWGRLEPADLLPLAVDRARALLTDHPALFGEATATMVVRDVAPEPLGGVRVRFGLRIAGLPVEGGDAIVVIDPGGRPRAALGRFPRRDRLDAAPRIPSAEAEAIALAFVGSEAAGLAVSAEGPPELLATVIEERVRPAWRVLVGGESNDGIARRVVRRELLVDAATGHVLRERERLVAARAVGSGIGVDGRRRELDVWRESDGRFVLRDGIRDIRTFTARTRERLPGVLVRSDSPTLWDAEPPGAGAAVDAHANAAVVFDYLGRILGRRSYDGDGATVRMVVHFGQDVDNAFWDGRHVVFGDGTGDVAPLAHALDVVAHELFHAVTERTSGLVYELESGSLSESLSDVFATLVELAHGENPVDWTIAEDVTDPPFRDLGRPWRNGLPSHMREYVILPPTPAGDMGGVHVNSTIPSHAAFRVAQALDPDRLTRIWWRAATVYLTPHARFADFAEATRAAAEDLYGPASAEVSAVEEAWRSVGVIE